MYATRVFSRSGTRTPRASFFSASVEITRRIGAFCLIALFVLATALAGKGYLWCVPMQQAMHACCCAEDAGIHADAGRDESPAVRGSCCDRLITADLPAGREAPPSDGVPPAPVAGFALPAALVELPRGVAQRPLVQASRPVRYGFSRAGPRFASDTCIRLQTFRC